MNILICDDEQAVGERVLQLTRDFFGSREIPVQCTLCTSGEEALSHREESFHLALLDVDLDTMSGIALGRELKAQNPELVLVYISAYLEFAPEGYTVHAYRYILKRDLDRMLPRCFEDLLAEETHRCRNLTVHLGRNDVDLPLDRIYYLESNLRKINVYGDVPHQPVCSYYGKLTDLPEKLFENGFLRVGRSYVVNMKYIRRISNYKVILRSGEELSVSRSGYGEIRGAFLEWKGQYGDA